MAPLKWHRRTFAVQIHDHPGVALVAGLVGGPFGIYCGTTSRVGPPEVGARSFTLVHLPSQSAKLTLPRQGLCREAAAEFASCALAWEQAWPPAVTGSPAELDKAREIYNRWKSYGVRRTWGARP